MNLFKIVKSLFTLDEVLKKVESQDEKIRKLEIENSAVQTSLRIIENGLEIKFRRDKK